MLFHCTHCVENFDIDQPSYVMANCPKCRHRLYPTGKPKVVDIKPEDVKLPVRRSLRADPTLHPEIRSLGSTHFGAYAEKTYDFESWRNKCEV